MYDGSYEEFAKRQIAESSSELKVEITGEGEGVTVPPGSRVLVHYTGRLTNGHIFDSSYDRGNPLDFVVGIGQVIRGWDEGIVQLKKG